MAKKKSSATSDEVSKYMTIFEDAYEKCSSDYERMISLQRSYDNSILKTAWPTNSQIPIAAFYDMVEKSLPTAMDYLFSPTNAIRLMPMEDGVKMDQVRKSEMALWHLLTYRMRIQRNSIATLKDCFKCGIGFGIVERFYVTPPASFELRVSGGPGEKPRSTRVMELGAPIESLRLRYINPGQVVVMPDGSDFNGNDPVSIAFLLDIYSEGQIRDMYNKKVEDGERIQLLGNVEDIVAESRSTGFTSDTDVTTMIQQLGGKNLSKLQPTDDRVPCYVPVLKVYDRHRHMWIANGTTMIYRQEDEFQNMRCPLVKASAWIDGNRFYPMSTPEAYQRIGWAKNVVLNLFMDMLTLNLRRPIVYNSEFFDKEPTFGPNDRIRTSAPDARMGAAFMEGPRIDPAAMTVYETINAMGASLTGQKNFMDKNYTRGGGMAFQDLLATTEGIDRLKGAILEMTFLESVANQALIYMQTAMGEEGMTIRYRERVRQPSGKVEDEIQTLTVTEDDLCHAYDLSLDLKSKYRKGVMEQNQSLAIFDRKMASPYFDHWEVAADHLCQSDEEIRRQLKSREEVAAMQEQQRQLQVQQQAANVIGTLQGGAPQEGAPQGGGAMAPEMGGEPGIPPGVMPEGE